MAWLLTISLITGAAVTPIASVAPQRNPRAGIVAACRDPAEYRLARAGARTRPELGQPLDEFG